MKRLLILLIPLLFLVGCKKEIKSTEGSIDLFTNIYYDASKGLTNYRQFYISKMDYKNDTILEFVPNVLFPSMMDRITFIKKDSFYKPVDYIEGKTTAFMKMTASKPQNVYKKQFGSKWVNFPIFGYDKRVKMSDTILYGNKEFSRFKTVQGKVLTIFYIKKTDTILPYSLNKIADQDYKGRLERIDSYDKEKDIFTTLVLIPRKKISEDGRELFSFNEKLNKMLNKLEKQKSK
ncbi:hypothetical protein NZD88_20805 [Chryseobacterium antibioticum]|uniref:Lipoprotein n=1 Tax=Chryseobacterium pyrolae TaxID=2987481 RepID=A0ABT2INR5_9FLAO|nr:hypothetical protein [Chryseobacterium pyrolae]MCT2410003.1 hypothetical protein [Chryseobacterium pyrolae]